MTSTLRKRDLRPCYAKEFLLRFWLNAVVRDRPSAPRSSCWRFARSQSRETPASFRFVHPWQSSGSAPRLCRLPQSCLQSAHADREIVSAPRPHIGWPLRVRAPFRAAHPRYGSTKSTAKFILPICTFFLLTNSSKWWRINSRASVCVIPVFALIGSTESLVRLLPPGCGIRSQIPRGSDPL